MNANLNDRKLSNVIMTTFVWWLWQVIIFSILNIIIGFVIGAVAGIGAASLEDASNVGAEACRNFFSKYGFQIGLINSFVAMFLLATEKLPFTNKFRNK